MSEPSGKQGIGGVRWGAIVLWVSGVVAVALALGFSIASLIEFSGHSSLCNLAACKTVSQSLFARSIPVPFPVVGVLAFGLQIGVAMALFRKPTQLRHCVWQFGCWLGGAVAIGLIAVQLVWLREIFRSRDCRDSFEIRGNVAEAC